MLLIATLIRTAILYITVIFSLRLMGKRQIGEMQPGELVITILISECAAAPIQDLGRPVINGIIAIFVLVILELIISEITLKSRFARTAIDGKSVIVIRDGVIDEKALKRLRFSVIELLEALRVAGYFNYTDVAYAILETNGVLSVLPKPEKISANASMVGKIPEKTGVQVVVIDDGKRNTSREVKELISDKEINATLKKENINQQDVLLMTVDSKKNITVVKKEKQTDG